MTKAAGLDTVLPGTKKKGEPDAAAMKTVARNTTERTKALTVKVSPELYRRLRLYALDSDSAASARFRVGSDPGRSSMKRLGVTWRSSMPCASHRVRKRPTGRA